MKRGISILLSGMMVLGCLTGCQGEAATEGNSTEQTTGTQDSQQGEAESRETQKEFSYPMENGGTVTWWSELNANISSVFTSQNETPLAKNIAEHTGVTVDFQHPPTGTATEQFGLMLADGNLPDIVTYNWLQQYSGGPEKAVADGVIIPLNDIMEQYCPNLTKYLQENPDIDKMVKTDSGLYYVFPFIREPGETVQYGPMMRGDWLEELNLEVPTTIDEWHTVLTAFKEQKGAAAPFTYVYSNARINSANPVALAYVKSMNFYLGEDGKIHYGSIEDGYRKYLETFSQWYEEGLVDIDLASVKNEQVAAKMTTGQAGAAIGNVEGNLGTWIVAGRKDNPDFTLVGTTWPTLEKGERPQAGYCENVYSGINCASITTSCKDVESAARMLDYFYSEEGSLFANFGEEGVTYTMENGEPVFTDVILNNADGWSKKTAQGAYTFKVSGYPHVADPRVPAQTMDLPEQLGARYGVWADTDAKKYLLPPITPSNEESKEYATIMNEIETYRDEMTIKYIMGQESLDTFDEYVATIEELGIARALEIEEAALKRYNER